MAAQSNPARRVLVLEPYYGGSHRAFLDALRAHSRHRFELLTLPARKWKWRMRGAALWFAQELASRPPTDADIILTSDMLSVADLRAMLPSPYHALPIACYFHENQLTYPLSATDRRDHQFAFTNITSCLTADAVWFNSASHRDAFLTAAGELLRQMPDHVPSGIVDRIATRSAVYWPPVDGPPSADASDDETQAARSASRAAAWQNPPTILWSHRWEYDKGPDLFFETMFRLSDAGRDFRLVLVGESFRTAPEIFGTAWERLRPRIAHCGFLEDRRDYWRWLAACDIVVSTAIQENFGIAVVEALLAGCWPILPARLSYPEILPAEFHDECLYTTREDLFVRLERRLAVDPKTGQPRSEPRPSSPANEPPEDRPDRLLRAIRVLHNADVRAAGIDDAIGSLATGQTVHLGP